MGLSGTWERRALPVSVIKQPWPRRQSGKRSVAPSPVTHVSVIDMFMLSDCMMMHAFESTSLLILLHAIVTEEV